MTTEIAAKDKAIQSIAQMLVANRAKLQKALPKHITPDRMIRVTLNSLSKNKDLLKCTQESLWEAIVEASTYGWEIGGPVAQAYLVPYKDRKSGVSRATLIPGFRGLMDLARRSGHVSNIVYGVVHKGDRFEQPEDPMDPMLIHQAAEDPKRGSKPVTHVWAGYLMTNGSRVYEVMTFDEINAHRDQYSKGHAKPDSAWSTAWESMAIKTVVKRPIMRGLVPIAAEHQRIMERDEVEGKVSSVEVIATPVDTLGHAQQVLPSPEQTTDAGEIDADEEWLLFSNEAAERMGKAKNLTQVNAVVEALNSEYVGDAHAKEVFDLSESRRAAIRGGRGDKTNH